MAYEQADEIIRLLRIIGEMLWFYPLVVLFIVIFLKVSKEIK